MQNISEIFCMQHFQNYGISLIQQAQAGILKQIEISGKYMVGFKAEFDENWAITKFPR